MSRCPHYVLHGQAEGDSNDRRVVYHHRCGLRIKEGQKDGCSHYPFQPHFDHVACDVYQQIFKSSLGRTGAIPARNIPATNTSLAREEVSEV